MGHISRQVQLFGIPGYSVIGYAAWHAQCQAEFIEGLVAEVSFHGLEMRSETEDKLMFRTLEGVKTKTGEEHINGVEMVLQKEDDGCWRLFQERKLNASETRHHKLQRA